MKIKITNREKEDLKTIIKLLESDSEENILLGISLVKKYRRFYKYMLIYDYNLVTPILCKDDLIDPFDDDLAIFKFSALMKDEDRYGILYFLESVVNEVDCFYQK